VLEEYAGAARSTVTFPECTGIGPPVDLRLEIAGQCIVLEHTEIEAFSGQIRMDRQFEDLIAPVIKELSGKLPGPAVYSLVFPIDAQLGLGREETRGALRACIEWVRENAQGLHDQDPLLPSRHQRPFGVKTANRGRPPGFPFDVTLQRQMHWRLADRFHGRLQVMRVAPPNVAQLRVARLEQALNRKCPKLALCKAAGARTVLVLEDSDVALSNHVLIGHGLAGLLAQRTDLPDDIYLVETAATPWSVRPLKRDDNLQPEDSWRDFEPAALVDLTGSAG
jgi:hypothetical protein